MQNYLDISKGTFPVQYLYRGGTGVNRNISTMTALLPYMEQQALYDSIYGDTSTALAEPWAAGATNGEPWRAEIPTILCPSDGNNKRPSSTAPGRNNYRFSHGDWAYPGGGGTGANQRRGIFGMTNHSTLGDVTDGTSNTLLASEHGTGGNEGHVASGAAVVPGVFDGSSNLSNPQTCLSAKINGKQIGGTGVTVVPAHNGATDRGYPTNAHGVSWGDGATFFHCFNTILPPNSPTCAVSSPQPQNVRTLVAPTSYHSGGVNAVRVDASVSFISDTVDTGSRLNEPPGASAGTFPRGESKYGVWGALGTPEGGEPRSL